MKTCRKLSKKLAKAKTAHAKTNDDESESDVNFNKTVLPLSSYQKFFSRTEHWVDVATENQLSQATTDLNVFPQMIL